MTTVELDVRDTTTGERLRTSISGDKFYDLCDRVGDPYDMPIDDLRDVVEEVRAEGCGGKDDG